MTQPYAMPPGEFPPHLEPEFPDSEETPMTPESPVSAESPDEEETRPASAEEEVWEEQDVNVIDATTGPLAEAAEQARPEAADRP
jgi:hypothetical protein